MFPVAASNPKPISCISRFIRGKTAPFLPQAQKRAQLYHQLPFTHKAHKAPLARLACANLTPF
jgi:hypothetical protein